MGSLISKIPEHKIHVIAPDIGGGFGNKVGAYPGYICAIVASIVTGRPVKWVEDRIENLSTTSFARDYHMDVFVEPVLPRPQIVVCGSSPVAVAIADLARRTGFTVTACAPASEQGAFAEVDRRIEGYALPVGEAGKRFVVVSTQGRGDEAALRAALAAETDYIAFVGSRKKAAALKAALAADGIDEARLARIKAPAGLDLGAITPEEIAVSILAEIVALRRGRERISAKAP